MAFRNMRNSIYFADSHIRRPGLDYRFSNVGGFVPDPRPSVGLDFDGSDAATMVLQGRDIVGWDDNNFTPGALGWVQPVRALAPLHANYTSTGLAARAPEFTAGDYMDSDAIYDPTETDQGSLWTVSDWPAGPWTMLSGQTPDQNALRLSRKADNTLSFYYGNGTNAQGAFLDFAWPLVDTVGVLIMQWFQGINMWAFLNGGAASDSAGGYTNPARNATNLTLGALDDLTDEFAGFINHFIFIDGANSDAAEWNNLGNNLASLWGFTWTNITPGA